jgi:ABC-2 type transport system ATP-binding protein
MMAPVLEARELTKRYNAVMAVREISFQIAPGEILGMLGPNGAGKSTIVKMITGMLEPSRGAVLFHGDRIGTELSAFKRQMGYVPEQPDLYGFLTGWEYLELVATLRGLDPRRFREKASTMLEALTLYASRDAPIASYSKGMRQRIVLISALMHDPELLVLDEPFSGLDVTSALVIRHVVARLALLAAPGAFSCFLMIDRYSTFLNWYRGHLHDDLMFTSIPDKYLFVALAMGVAGIVTVLKWDQIVPDSQDYLNLAPLPIRSRRILLANAAAILIAVAIAAVAVNAVSSLLFPFFVSAAAQISMTEFLRFVAVHAVCVLTASFFAICASFAVLGTLCAVLPRALFRSWSPALRGVFLVAWIAVLLSGFAGSGLVRHLQLAPHSALRYLPSLWYLGLYQTIQHRGPASLAALAPLSLRAAAAAFALMLLSYAVSYRKLFAATAEAGRRPSQQRLSALTLAILDRFASRSSGFDRACHRFAIRALLRNETHRLAIAVAAGLGYLVAFQSDTAARPLAAIYLLVLGLRIAFELPAGVSSNWMFRAILDPRENETLPVARRVMLSFVVPLVLVPDFALAWWYWGPITAAVHTLYVLALTVCLIEVQLVGYRKVPLTCPMPGFRDNLPMMCLLQFLGFALFTRAGSGLEQWMRSRPPAFLLVPAAMAAAWHWNRRRLAEAREAGELEEGVIFENAPVRAVERLNLSDG